MSVSTTEKSWRGSTNCPEPSDQLPPTHPQAISDSTLGSPCFCFCFIWYGSLAEVTSNEWNSKPASQSWIECAAKRPFCSDVYKENDQSVHCVTDIDLWTMYGNNVHMYLYIYTTIFHDKLMMSIVPTWKMQKWSKSHMQWALGNQLNVSSTADHCPSFFGPLFHWRRTGVPWSNGSFIRMVCFMALAFSGRAYGSLSHHMCAPMIARHHISASPNYAHQKYFGCKTEKCPVSRLR